LNRESRLALTLRCECQTVKKDLSRCMFWGQNMGPTADETLQFGALGSQ